MRLSVLKFPLQLGLLCLSVLTITPAACDDSGNEALRSLEQARAALHISEAARQDVEKQLQQVRDAGSADPETLRNYEDYLARLQAIVEEKRTMLRSMEKAYARHAPPVAAGQGPAGAPLPDNASRSAYSMAPNSTELEALEHDLRNSFADFDEMLLREMDTIRRQSAARMAELNEQASAAADRLKNTETGAQAGAGNQESETGRDNSTFPENQSDNGTSSVDSKTSPQRRPPENAQDDDIVARQLREAAEKETDPELKEKLWKEYEDYKRSGR